MLPVPGSATDASTDFLAARKALSAGKIKEFERLRDGLEGYPLQPYLDYFALSRRLSRAGENDVSEFLDKYEGQVIADRLRRAWLDKAAQRQRWSTLVKFYRSSVADVDLQCQYQQARLETGQTKTAMLATGSIWLAGKSLPSSCDPLFDAWYKHGYPEPALAWQRFQMAMNSGSSHLAKYLQRFLGEREASRAQRWLQLHRQPSALRKTSKHLQLEPRMLAHGLKQLARRDTSLGAKLFATYQQHLDTVDRDQIHLSLVVRMATREPRKALDWSLSNSQPTEDHAVVEMRARLAILLHRWDLVLSSVAGLPIERREAPRWRYWRARASGAVHSATSQHAAEPLKGLAQERSYYGFLAADLLKSRYSMQDHPAPANPSLLERLGQLPGIERARELYKLDMIVDARREWRHATRNMNPTELVSAATLAADWGWHHQAIFAMIGAEYWDDLQIRFPLAYADTLRKAAQVSKLPPSLVFAIARQESAFGADARSPAGALGLMQLMPATARQTAKRGGLSFSGNQQLLDPETNARLGSYYMGELMQRFKGNRILAVAAYNAGPHNVKKWLNRLPSEVGHDVFIESIPFKETRNYVQNVLAFTVIYGYRLGQQHAMIQPGELRIGMANKLAGTRH